MRILRAFVLRGAGVLAEPVLMLLFRGFGAFVCRFGAFVLGVKLCTFWSCSVADLEFGQRLSVDGV